jgi:hypothetical protein
MSAAVVGSGNVPQAGKRKRKRTVPVPTTLEDVTGNIEEGEDVLAVGAVEEEVAEDEEGGEPKAKKPKARTVLQAAAALRAQAKAQAKTDADQVALAKKGFHVGGCAQSVAPEVLREVLAGQVYGRTPVYSDEIRLEALAAANAGATNASVKGARATKWGASGSMSVDDVISKRERAEADAESGGGGSISTFTKMVSKTFSGQADARVAALDEARHARVSVNRCIMQDGFENCFRDKIHFDSGIFDFVERPSMSEHTPQAALDFTQMNVQGFGKVIEPYLRNASRTLSVRPKCGPDGKVDGIVGLPNGTLNYTFVLVNVNVQGDFTFNGGVSEERFKALTDALLLANEEHIAENERRRAEKEIDEARIKGLETMMQKKFAQLPDANLSKRKKITRPVAEVVMTSNRLGYAYPRPCKYTCGGSYSDRKSLCRHHKVCAQQLPSETSVQDVGRARER